MTEGMGHARRGIFWDHLENQGPFFFFEDVFDVDHFESLYCICYNLVSVLQFGFLASRHVES